MGGIVCLRVNKRLCRSVFVCVQQQHVRMHLRCVCREGSVNEEAAWAHRHVPQQQCSAACAHCTAAAAHPAGKVETARAVSFCVWCWLACKAVKHTHVLV